jgi:excisionase family DNA binding protein
MRTHKTPGTKKRANGAAHANKRRGLEPKRVPLVQPRAEPPSAAEPMLDLRNERTLTVQEVAYRLGKSEDGIRKMLQRGALKGWQVGGRFCSILVSEASVEEMLITGTRRFGE